jgi:hypothetical protein
MAFPRRGSAAQCRQLAGHAETPYSCDGQSCVARGRARPPHAIALTYD